MRWLRVGVEDPYVGRGTHRFGCMKRFRQGLVYLYDCEWLPGWSNTDNTSNKLELRKGYQSLLLG